MAFPVPSSRPLSRGSDYFPSRRCQEELALPLLLKLQEVARDALDVLNIAIRLLRVLHDETLHLD